MPIIWDHIHGEKEYWRPRNVNKRSDFVLGLISYYGIWEGSKSMKKQTDKSVLIKYHLSEISRNPISIWRICSVDQRLCFQVCVAVGHLVLEYLKWDIGAWHPDLLLIWEYLSAHINLVQKRIPTSIWGFQGSSEIINTNCRESTT